jgi:hypothetical protein
MRAWIGGAAFALLAASGAHAESAFDGTWKGDVGSAQMPAKPDSYLLSGGSYSCKTCTPPFTIKADGTDQPVSGHPYFDTEAVKVVDEHTVQFTDKKNGKVVTTSTVTITPDDKTATFEFSDSSASSGAPVTGKGTQTRVAAGPKGAHAISGSWRTTKFASMSDNGLTVNFKVNGNSLTMTSPTGQSYTAKLDGMEAPMKGDPGVTTVSVKKLSDNKIEETDKRGAKTIAVVDMTVEADGKTMDMAYHNKLRGTTTRYKAMKQ